MRSIEVTTEIDYDEMVLRLEGRIQEVARNETAPLENSQRCAKPTVLRNALSLKLRGCQGHSQNVVSWTGVSFQLGSYSVGVQLFKRRSKSSIKFS